MPKKLRKILLVPIASFLLGLVVPEMGLVNYTSIPWIISVAIAFYCLFLFTSDWAHKFWFSSMSTRGKVIGIVISCICISVLSFWGATTYIQGFQVKKDLTIKTDQLVTDVRHFYSERVLDSPQPPLIPGTNTLYPDKADSWSQQSIDYDRETGLLFVISYRQKVIDVATQLWKLKVINDDELRHLDLYANNEYPAVQMALTALEDYDMRLHGTPIGKTQTTIIIGQ
jgi:hypothetical protein